MTRRISLDLLRPGCTCPVLAAVPVIPVCFRARRSVGLQTLGMLSPRATAPRSIYPAERWWTSHPS